MSFYDIVNKYSWDDIAERIYSSTKEDVVRALSASGELSPEDMIPLLSPAASGMLEQIAQKSMDITRRRFGNVMQLYVPLYISSYCQNRCLYCGFSVTNKIPRKQLSQEEIATECKAIGRDPFRHILLVTGESTIYSSVEYLGDSIETALQSFEQVSIEVQPLQTHEYKQLVEKGLHGVYVYQETYNEARYGEYHPKGRKANYRYRLETPDRLGEAGVYKIGFGNLIGLEDWRVEAFFTALHIDYISKKYWRSKCSVSFPRLRPCVGDGFNPNFPSTESDLLQIMCAYRLFSEDLEISLSTRESPYFRDNVARLGVTTMSAASKTTPGGYSDYEANKELEQFSVNDDRSAQAVAAAIRERGLEPVWKDWSHYLHSK